MTYKLAQLYSLKTCKNYEPKKFIFSKTNKRIIGTKSPSFSILRNLRSVNINKIGTQKMLPKNLFYHLYFCYI